MNFAMIILGVGALLLVATTMGRKEPTDPGVEDEEAYLASLEEGQRVDSWTFGQRSSIYIPMPVKVPTVPGLPAWQTSREAQEAFAEEGL